MPFTPHDFFTVFEKYNSAIFPMQIVLTASALYAVSLGIRSKPFSNRVVSAILASFWLWTGLIYHLTFFVEINPLAYLFGGLFVIQGILFILEGVWKQSLRFQFKPDFYGFLGLILLVYALVIYPLLGYWLRQTFLDSPTFGAPCPMTIFTFGILMWTDKKFPLWLLIIPVGWMFVGSSAAITFAVLEDLGLLVAGTLGTAFIMQRVWLSRLRTR